MLLQALVPFTLWQAILIVGMLSTHSKGMQVPGRCFHIRQGQLTSEIIPALPENISLGACTGVDQILGQDSCVIFFRFFNP